MKKKFIIIGIVVTIILLLQISRILPSTIANVSSLIYIKLNYKDINVEHYQTEYDTHFGEYIVNYRDENNNQFSFIMAPPFFPIVVSHDPFADSP